jgi:hypothetical protein
VPDGTAAQGQQRDYDDELSAADALLTAVAVIPGKHEYDWEPDE